LAARLGQNEFISIGGKTLVDRFPDGIVLLEVGKQLWSSLRDFGSSTFRLPDR